MSIDNDDDYHLKSHELDDIQREIEMKENKENILR